MPSRVSLDTSFVYAVLKHELPEADHRRAIEMVEAAASVHVPMLVVEELLRFDPARELTDRLMVIRTAILELVRSAETWPLTIADAAGLAELWLIARKKDQTSTTVDTLIAREAALHGGTLLTTDGPQATYMGNAFGLDRVVRFATAPTPD